jgi:hypothetical protein
VRVLRWLDLALLALALPVFLAVGAPLLGWGAVAAVWIVLRALPGRLMRRAVAAQDARRGTMVLAGGMIARVWLLALTIFAAGSVEREAGLGAALLSIALVTVNLVGLMMRGPFGGSGTGR